MSEMMQPTGSDDTYYFGTNEHGKDLRLARKFKFTETRIADLPCTVMAETVAERQRKHWDTGTPGLGLLVGMDAKTFFVQAQHPTKGTKRVSIGRYPKIRLDDARRMAKKLIAEITAGGDPVEDRRRERDERQQQEKKARTVRDLWKEYLDVRELKPNTKRQYELLRDRHFTSLLDLPAEAITEEKALSWFMGIKAETPAYAVQAARLLRALFLAADLPNPCRKFRNKKALPKIKERTTVVKDSDLGKFFKAIDEVRAVAAAEKDKDGKLLEPHMRAMHERRRKVVCDYIEFVAFTGLRKNEAARLKWSNVDFNEKALKITETKTDETLEIPLSEHAMTILERRQAAGGEGEWVFPSPALAEDGPLVEPKNILNEIRERAGITFTLHDLRRTLITTANRLKIDFVTHMRLTNHKLNDVHAKYIITDRENDLRPAAEAISQYFLSQKTKALGHLKFSGNQSA